MSFDGTAVESSGISDLLAEDFAPQIRLLAPRMVFFLDALPQAIQPVPNSANPAQNVLTQWSEDVLHPLTFVMSTALGSETTANSFGFAVANMAKRYMPGTVVMVPATGERMVISAIDRDNNIATVSRGAASTTTRISTIAAGTEIDVKQLGANDGSIVDRDLSGQMSLRSNWVKPYWWPILSADTMGGPGGVRIKANESPGGWHEYQETKALKSLLRFFEIDVLTGKTLGNSYGGGTADTQRQFNGVWAQIENEDAGAGTLIATLAGGTLTNSTVNSFLEGCYRAGLPADTITVDPYQAKEIDALLDSVYNVRTDQESSGQYVGTFISRFAKGGRANVLMTVSAPRNSMLFHSLEQIEIAPLDGFSFQLQRDVPRGRRLESGIKGDYTVRCTHVECMRAVTKNAFIY